MKIRITQDKAWVLSTLSKFTFPRDSLRGIFVLESIQSMRHFIVPRESTYLCEHCGHQVLGGRYNNHCPACLWSKHLDKLIPGDRASTCLGLMQPVAVIQKHGSWRIVHVCLKCGHQFTVDSAPGDNVEVIIQIASNQL